MKTALTLVALLSLLITACDDVPAPATTAPRKIVCRTPDGRVDDTTTVGRKTYVCHPDGYWREQ